MNRRISNSVCFCLLLASNVVAQTPDTTAHPPANTRGRNPPAPAYVPITGEGRFNWIIEGTVGYKSLVAGAFNAGMNTFLNEPPEWRNSGSGFWKRYGTRQANVGISNTLEASLGSLWGEDPRYIRSTQTRFWPRTKYALASAFVTYRSDGRRGPAYARLIAIPSARAVTNTWRPPSSTDWRNFSFQPLGTGFMFRCTSNIFSEFWPDLARKFKLPH